MSHVSRLRLLVLILVAVGGLGPAAARAACPCTPLAEHGTSRDRHAVRQLGGGAGREVPQRHGGLRQGRALLQGQPEHRHARRKPVDHRRAPAWRRRPSPARPRAAGRRSTFAAPVAISRGHHLRGLVPHDVGFYAGDNASSPPPASTRRRCTRWPTAGRWQRRLRLRRGRLPVAQLPAPPTTGSTSSSTRPSATPRRPPWPPRAPVPARPRAVVEPGDGDVQRADAAATVEMALTGPRGRRAGVNAATTRRRGRRRSTPSADLAASTSYTATVERCADAAGNTMTPSPGRSRPAAPPPPPPTGRSGPILLVASSREPVHRLRGRDPPRPRD